MAAPRKYPIELQQRAVRLWRDSQPRRPIAHIARELGVHPEALRTWIRQDEADRGQRDDRLSSQQLVWVLAEDADHYNRHRPHRALGQAPPLQPNEPVVLAPAGRILRRDRVRGLIHEYAQVA